MGTRPIEHRTQHQPARSRRRDRNASYQQPIVSSTGTVKPHGVIEAGRHHRPRLAVGPTSVDADRSRCYGRRTGIGYVGQHATLQHPIVSERVRAASPGEVFQVSGGCRRIGEVNDLHPESVLVRSKWPNIRGRRRRRPAPLEFATHLVSVERGSHCHDGPLALSDPHLPTRKGSAVPGPLDVVMNVGTGLSGSEKRGMQRVRIYL